MFGFIHQFMGNAGFEGQAKVIEEYPEMCVWVLQVRQGCMKCNGDAVLRRSVFSVRKLGTDNWEDVLDV